MLIELKGGETTGIPDKKGYITSLGNCCCCTVFVRNTTGGSVWIRKESRQYHEVVLRNDVHIYSPNVYYISNVDCTNMSLSVISVYMFEFGI